MNEEYEKGYDRGVLDTVEECQRLERENKHLLDLQKSMDKQYSDLEHKNQKLKQWDNNKDSRNSRQRVANKKLLKKNEVLEYNWNELKKWLEEEIYKIEPKGTAINYNCEYDSEEDYINAMKERSKLITLKRVLIMLQSLEDGGNNE